MSIGEVVLLEGRGVHPSVNGQRGVLLQRDPASGRYRARLCAEPWKCVKVTRSAIHHLNPSEQVGACGSNTEAPSAAIRTVEIDEGGNTTAATTASDPMRCFDKLVAKCDHSLGVFKKIQKQVLPPELKKMPLVCKTWPPSPVKRGRMREGADPLPRIEQGELYRALQEIAPHAPEHRQLVHRQRRYGYSIENVAGMPDRRAPVQKGKPHRRLPPANSEDLAALVDEDLRAEFDRKIHQSFHSPSYVPKHESDFALDQLREEEMEERLERIQLRQATAKKEREEDKAARAAAHYAELQQLQQQQRPVTVSSGTADSELYQASIAEDPAEEESFEQRISREFKEYELESLSHPSTPNKKDHPVLGTPGKRPSNKYEGSFEEDEEEFEADTRDAAQQSAEASQAPQKAGAPRHAADEDAEEFEADLSDANQQAPSSFQETVEQQADVADQQAQDVEQLSADVFADPQAEAAEQQNEWADQQLKETVEQQADVADQQAQDVEQLSADVLADPQAEAAEQQNEWADQQLKVERVKIAYIGGRKYVNDETTKKSVVHLIQTLTHLGAEIHVAQANIALKHVKVTGESAQYVFLQNFMEVDLDMFRIILVTPGGPAAQAMAKRFSGKAPMFIFKNSAEGVDEYGKDTGCPPWLDELVSHGVFDFADLQVESAANTIMSILSKEEEKETKKEEESLKVNLQDPVEITKKEKEPQDENLPEEKTLAAQELDDSDMELF